MDLSKVSRSKFRDVVIRTDTLQFTPRADFEVRREEKTFRGRKKCRGIRKHSSDPRERNQ